MQHNGVGSLESCQKDERAQPRSLTKSNVLLETATEGLLKRLIFRMATRVKKCAQCIYLYSCAVVPSQIRYTTICGFRIRAGFRRYKPISVLGTQTLGDHKPIFMLDTRTLGDTS